METGSSFELYFIGVGLVNELSCKLDEQSSACAVTVMESLVNGSSPVGVGTKHL